MIRREPTDEELLAMLEGELTSSRAGTIDTHVHTCASCRARLDALQGTLDSIATIEPESASIDLVGAMWERIEQPALNPRRSFGAVALALAAATAALAIILPVSRSDFRPKSGAAHRSDRWTGIRIYRADEDGAHPVDRRIRSDDYLLFSYANLAERPARHLMIFGVDQSRAVHWYYPAHLDPGQDPTSIRIEAAPSRELREKIRHDLPPGDLTIHALFTEGPLYVSMVESAVAGGRLDDLTASGAHQKLHLEVAR